MQTIQDLKIEGITREFFINVQKRSIISCEGLKYNEETYYTPEQIPNGLYNVEYKNNNINVSKPKFDIKIDIKDNDKYEIKLSNIKFDGYIEKWQAQYKLQNESHWNTSDSLNFVVEKEGNYDIKVKNDNLESDVQTINTGHIYEEGICKKCNDDARYLTFSDYETRWDFNALCSFSTVFGKRDTSGQMFKELGTGNTINASCTANFNAETMQGNHSLGGNIGMIIYKEPIDVTNINKIVMDCWLSSNAKTATNYTTLGIDDTNSASNYDDYYSFVTSSKVENYGTALNKYKIELDLSNYTGKYYLKVTTRHEFPDGIANTSSTSIDKIYPVFNK